MLSQRRTSDWFLRRGGMTAEMVAESAPRTRLGASRETGRYRVSFAVVSVEGHVTPGRTPSA